LFDCFHAFCGGVVLIVRARGRIDLLANQGIIEKNGPVRTAGANSDTRRKGDVLDYAHGDCPALEKQDTDKQGFFIYRPTGKNKSVKIRPIRVP
jgi:hypothetical protein